MIEVSPYIFTLYVPLLKSAGMDIVIFVIVCCKVLGNLQGPSVRTALANLGSAECMANFGLNEYLLT